MKQYLLIDLDVNVVSLAVAANHSEVFPYILAPDWLSPKGDKIGVEVDK